MEWWDDLWLNEGFASFVEYYGVNATEPDWKVVMFVLQRKPFCFTYPSGTKGESTLKMMRSTQRCFKS